MKYVISIWFIFFTILSFSQNWEILNADYTYVYDISGHDSTLYITGRKDGHFVFAYSDDDASTWNEVVLDGQITVELGIPICVGFFNAQEGIIGIKGNFTREYLMTSDGGLTWEAYTPELSPGCGNIPQPFKIVVVNDSTAVIAQFQSGDYLITRDKGETWDCESSFTTSWLPNFTTINQNIFYNFDTDALYKSNDAGISWNPALDVADLAAYQMLDEETGFAAGAYYSNPDANPVLYATTDGWTSFDTSPLPALNDKLINAIVPISADELFLVETENIHYSDDGGQTVSFHQGLDFEPTSAVKIGEDWYLTGRGLARYEGGGVINGTQNPKQAETIRIFPNPVTQQEIHLDTDFFTAFDLYSLDGYLIDRGVISENMIRLKKVPAGLYILHVTNRTESVRNALKIIIVE